MLPTNVVCDSRVGFVFSNIYKVSMEGVAFDDCARSGVVQGSSTYYGIYLQSVQTAEIIDCTSHDSYGSALWVADSHVVLRGSRFLNNCRMCSNGRWCDGYGYQAPRCYGSGVFVQRSNLTITGSSRFSGNLASDDGGVYAQHSSNVHISGNTTFIGNPAMSNGGGVYAQYSSNVYISGNTTFIGNSASGDSV